ncbi:MAG: prephenate dehydrogenase/arogenate dehydrogenase family protein [Dehalococcoidia bacterium]|nr:prephenate dehydrogenase/arogenate dehydrogenase family protein [Dehalococcoidia bacterium]
MRITIIGIGLIGASLGMALKRARGTEFEVVGFARDPQIAERAVRCKAIDRSESSLGASVRGSNLIVVCTPVLAVEEVFQEMAGHLHIECVVTDTASTKRQVMEWAKRDLRGKAQFVGGHPMAGKEKSGVDAADPELFRGCTYCLVPAEWANREAVDLTEQFVRAVGASPLYIEAGQHDFLVAGVSHLPTLVSAALVDATTGSAEWPLMAKLAASGFRDVTRLASGNARMNADIFATNRSALVQWIDMLDTALQRLKCQIANADCNLEDKLASISRAREHWMEFKSGNRTEP